MISINDEFVNSLRETYGENIAKLNLSSNGLKDISKLQAFGRTISKLTLNQNELSDTSQFAVFTNLVELHVAENRICDISPLQSLSKLEFLDLSGNQIHSLTQLQALKRMPRLAVCNLKGNPIAMTAEYPVEVFRLQPHLLRVDDWSREEAIEMDNSLKLTLNSQVSNVNTQSLLSSTASQLLTAPEKIILSLQQQLQTMHEAFALQEKALEHNGLEAAQYAMALNPFSRQFSTNASKYNSNQTLTKQNPQIHHRSQQYEDHLLDKELVTKFPYYRLLQMWRKKTLTIMLHSQRLQQELQQLYRLQANDRVKHQQAHQTLECQVMKWKTRTQVLDEQVKMLTKQQQDLQLSLENTTAQQQSSTRQILDYQLIYQQLQEILIRFQAQQDPSRQALQQVSLLQQVTQQCHKYEMKLQKCQEQITRLSEYLFYQQVQHRNAQAMVEAERRLQQLRFVQHISSHEDFFDKKDENKEPVAAEQHVTENKKNGKFMSDLQLSPEAESLLKTLFQSLDVTGCGHVSCVLWTQSLLKDEDTYHSWLLSYYKDDNADHNTKSNMKIGEEELSGYGRLLLSALGQTTFQFFIHSLFSFLATAKVLNNHVYDTSTQKEPATSTIFLDKKGEQDKENNTFNDENANDSDDQQATEQLQLTWGELLLHLIPNLSTNDSSASMFRASLTVKEWHALQLENIWQRYQLGLLPLQLPADIQTPLILGAVKNSNSNNISGNKIHVDWAKERHVLMQRLQTQLQHETRLIENVKAYFVKEMRLQELQEQRLRHNLAALQEENQRLQARWQQAEATRTQQQDSWQQRLHVLQEENETLHTRLTRMQTEETTQYEALLQEHQAKYQRLEKEHQLLQREQAKKDVKIKALERDVLRLQSAQTVTVQDMHRMQETCQEQLAQERQEKETLRLAHLQERHTWEEEKEHLLKKLAATQEELLDLCRAPPTVPTTTPVPVDQANENKHEKKDDSGKSSNNNNDSMNASHNNNNIHNNPKINTTNAPFSAVSNDNSQDVAPPHHTQVQPLERALMSNNNSDHYSHISNNSNIHVPSGIPHNNSNNNNRGGNLQVYGAHLEKLLQIMDNLYDGSDA